MISAAVTRASRVRAGKCSVCLKRRRSPGHATCRTCRQGIAEYSAARYAERTAAKECVRCGAPADGYLCEEHAAERRERRANS